MGAARYGDRPALIDERGPVSFAELDARSDAIARGLIETGVHAGDTVGVLCRNHRYFFEITGALAKLGANALYLNTGFAAPQIDAVRAARAGGPARARRRVRRRSSPRPDIEPRLLAWTDDATPTDGTRTLDDLAPRHADGPRLARPARDGPHHHPDLGHDRAAQGRARRASTPHVGAGIALLERLPYRAHEKMVDRRAVLPRVGIRQRDARACCSATRWCSSGTSIRSSHSR